MKTVFVVLKSKSTGELFRLEWKGELRWTEFPLLAFHYENVLAANLAAMQMGIELAVEAQLVDLAKEAA